VKDFVHLLCRTSFRYIGQLVPVLYPASAIVHARRAGPQHRFMQAHARAWEGVEFRRFSGRRRLFLSGP